MVTVVCVINTLIALILLYVAWRVHKLGLRLARIADRLSALERKTHAMLDRTPDAITKGQRGILKLRQGNEPLQLQLLRVQQVLSLLGVGQLFWQGTRFTRRPIFLKKSLPKYR